MTRLGYFEKTFASNFLTKVAQIFSGFLGSSDKCPFLVKTVQGSFWATLGGGIWATLKGNWATIYINIRSHCKQV